MASEINTEMINSCLASNMRQLLLRIGKFKIEKLRKVQNWETWLISFVNIQIPFMKRVRHSVSVESNGRNLRRHNLYHRICSWMRMIVASFRSSEKLVYISRLPIIRKRKIDKRTIASHRNANRLLTKYSKRDKHVNWKIQTDILL